MLSEQLHMFTQLMRQEKWSEAEATARSISSLDKLECNLKYIKNLFYKCAFFALIRNRTSFNLIIFRLAEVCLAKGDFPKGLEYISIIMKDADVTPLYIIRATLLFSQIMCASSSPGNGSAVATNCIVRLCSALELATRNHLSYYKALVKMHLANTQVSFLY